MKLKTGKIDPDSGVELNPVTVNNYDKPWTLLHWIFIAALFTGQLRQWILNLIPNILIIEKMLFPVGWINILTNGKISEKTIFK